ncbi:TonB-dependent receptor [Povalibacter sp.]|uniref:TonB-dependent receptor n=1 Tax=Povalibacter sp. TaxID=1962978 RepID=UPI002F3E6676
MKDRKTIRSLMTGAGMALSVTVSTPAISQQSTEGAASNRIDVLHEVVVSARKRDESVQEIPLTVNAFSEAEIAARGIDDLKDLSSNTPGLIFFTPGDRSISRMAIRGMSQVTPSGDTTRDIASIFIDGVYYSGQTAGLAFDDIERVEVIKGPQSAYFGRSTFAGAINFITKRPHDEFEAKLDLSAAEYDDYSGRLSVNVPVIENLLAMRVVGGYNSRGGQYKDATSGDGLGEQRDTYGVLSALLTPGDRVSALLRLSYTQNVDGPPASQTIARQADHNCGPFADGAVTNNGRATTLYCGELRFRGQPDLNDTIPVAAGTLFFDSPRTERDMVTASLNLDVELPANLTFTSLSSYQTEKQESVMDYDLTNVDAYWAETFRDQDTITQELRLTSDSSQRLRWMGGLYYLEQDYYTQARFAYGTIPTFRVPGLTGTVTAPAPNPKEVENKAVFASVSYDLTDRLEIALEGRYQNDKIIAPAQGAGAQSLVVESSAFLPRLLLSFQADDDTNLYLNVAKGNQPTQGNPQLLFLTPERRGQLAASWGIPLIVPESKIVNYEIGLKKTLADGRATFNTALFYSQWEGKQDTKGAQVDFNGNGTIDIGLAGANREAFSGQAAVAGDEDVYGVEIETRFLFTDAIEIGAAATWTEVDFKRGSTSNIVYRYFGGDPITQTGDITGRKEGFVPDLSATAYLQYRAAFNASLDWRARADGIYVGSRYDSLLNMAETGESFDLNVSIGLEAEKWTASLRVRNLLDDDTLESISYQGDAAGDPLGFRLYSAQAALPFRRQIGMDVSYRF